MSRGKPRFLVACAQCLSAVRWSVAWPSDRESFGLLVLIESPSIPTPLLLMSSPRGGALGPSVTRDRGSELG